MNGFSTLESPLREETREEVRERVTTLGLDKTLSSQISFLRPDLAGILPHVAFEPLKAVQANLARIWAIVDESVTDPTRRAVILAGIAPLWEEFKNTIEDQLNTGQYDNP